MSVLTAGHCRPKRIGIVGYYHGNNLGDDTVVAILIHKIKERYPDAEIVGFSLDPADTARRYGIRAFPIRPHSDASRRRRPPLVSGVEVKPSLFSGLKRRLKEFPIIFTPLKYLKVSLCELPRAVLADLSFLPKTFRQLRSFDLLVVPGSGHLTDWWGSGAWEHPYTLLSWFLLARMNGTKVIALSIGAERLNTWLGKRFCKWALSIANYRSFRDRYSRDTMEALGLKGDNPVVPDQGFAVLDLVDLDRTQTTRTECERPTAGLTVGVVPVGKGATVADGEDDSWHGVYIEKLAAFLSWLIQRECQVTFCHTETHDQFSVDCIVEKIRSACPYTDLAGRIIQDAVETTETLVSRFEQCDVVIASRFHGVVLPFALHKPVLAISYGRKMGDLMAQCGQAGFHLPMNEANLDCMKRVFQALEQNRHAIARHLETVVADFRASLERQYEEVFGPLEHGRQAAPRTSDTGGVDCTRLDIEEAVQAALMQGGAGTGCPD